MRNTGKIRALLQLCRRIAKKYTQKCFPEWYKKFSNCRRGMSYLTDFSRFRWYPEIMPDTDELYLKTPGEILEIILRKG